MRKIDTSAITTTVSAYFKSGTMDHLQLAYQEAISALAQMQIGGLYDPTKVYILCGCIETNGVGNFGVPTIAISPGAIFYANEIFQFSGNTIAAVYTPSIALMFSINYSNYISTAADPVIFSDGSSHNIHLIRTIQVSFVPAGTGIANFDDAIRVLSPSVTTVQTTSSSITETVSFVENSISLNSVLTSYQLASLAIAYDFNYAVPGAKTKLYACASAGSITISFPHTSSVMTFLPNVTTGSNATSTVTITINDSFQKGFMVEMEYLGENSAGTNMVIARVYS